MEEHQEKTCTTRPLSPFVQGAVASASVDPELRGTLGHIAKGVGLHEA